MSKEQGFLVNVCQPRVSQYLSRILTEYDDGHQVNIPELIKSYIVNLASDRRVPFGAFQREICLGYPQTQMNLWIVADSRSQ